MTAESASPPAAELDDLITRFVRLTEGRPIRDLGEMAGVHGAYISKWRGGFRPTRMQAHAVTRLRRAVAELERAGGGVLAAALGAAAAADPIQMAREVLARIESHALSIAREASEARAQLTDARDETPPSPSASAIADGLAALRTLEEQQAGTPKGRRKGRG